MTSMKLLYASLAFLFAAALLCRPVKAMNKAELIDAVASSSGLSKADAKRAFDGFAQSIQMHLAEKGEVYISEFGAFKIARDIICDGRDNDCNGRFYCKRKLSEQQYMCGGTVCNGIDVSYGSDGVCTGIDNDCDALDDDSDGDSIEFYAAPEVVQYLGKYYGWYWMDVAMSLANELDVWANKSYTCRNGVRCPSGECKANEICTVKNPIYEESGNQGESPLYSCNYVEIVTKIMGMIKDVLVLDSDDDGDSVPSACKEALVDGSGHVTFVKCLLLGDGNHQSIAFPDKLADQCGLNSELRTFVEDFLRQATDALDPTITNDSLKDMAQKDNREDMIEWMASKLERGITIQRSANIMKNQADTHLRTDHGAKEIQHTVVKAESALKAIIQVITAAASTGETVSILEFGSFSISDHPVRLGRNPQTGKEIKIAAKNVVKFKAGKALSNTVKAAEADGSWIGTLSGCSPSITGGDDDWVCSTNGRPIQCTCTHL